MPVSVSHKCNNRFCAAGDFRKLKKYDYNYNNNDFDVFLVIHVDVDDDATSQRLLSDWVHLHRRTYDDDNDTSSQLSMSPLSSSTISNGLAAA